MDKPASSTSTSKDDQKTRLLTLKTPRDLTLSATATTSKPNKKVFTPNLNVVRNKTKQQQPSGKPDKKFPDRNKKDKNQNRHNKGSSNIVKSSGIFSEGVAAAERSSFGRASYNRDGDSGSRPVLNKPFIKVKDVFKIDKELEEEKINKLFEGHNDGDDGGDNYDDLRLKDEEGPIKLPMTAPEQLILPLPRKKSTVTVKQEVFENDDINPIKPLVSSDILPDLMPERRESIEILKLLHSETPKMLLLQLPNSLPGQGKEEKPSKEKLDAGETSEPIEKKCILSDMEEGKIGKILIYKSGKVKMKLGSTLFDITLGTQNCFQQDIVSVAVNDESRNASMINLGPIDKKLTVIPEWETLFTEFNI